jgi:hypothetical protein
MGPKETQQMYIRTCIDRSAIVALSAEPPGVNELCVCIKKNRNIHLLIPSVSVSFSTLKTRRNLPGLGA